MSASGPGCDLSVQLGPIRLPSPILVASGTFGYAREMAHLVDLSRLGAVLPKTITSQPRAGNRPWRTVETTAGLLNSIGLDNDGLEAFVAHHLPYLSKLACPVIVSIAGSSHEDFCAMAQRLGQESGIAALELNISCPNVAHGVDFGVNAEICRRLVAGVREVCKLPLIAKLTPNVTDVLPIAKAAADGGADAVSLVNTFVGMAVDWRRRRPILGNVTGGVSGPAIKPMVLRIVWRVASANVLPVIAVGGIGTLDDVMEFLVAGASAVQLGTVNFFDPTASVRVVEGLPGALAALGAGSVREVVGTLRG